VNEYISSPDAIIEVKDVKIEKNGIHHEITNLEVQEKSQTISAPVPGFESSFTENTNIAIVLVLQQCLVSANPSPQNNKAKHNLMISFAQKIVDECKSSSTKAKENNPNAQRNYHISVVGYGDVDHITTTEFSNDLSKVKQDVGALSNLDQYAALSEAVLAANNKLNTFPTKADYKCIIVVGGGEVTGSNITPNQVVEALKIGPAQGIYCLGVQELNTSFDIFGEQNFTTLTSAAPLDGNFAKADIVEKVRPFFEGIYRNIPNNYDLKYTRSATIVEEVQTKWVFTIKAKS
jgi:hypothetical protein